MTKSDQSDRPVVQVSQAELVVLLGGLKGASIIGLKWGGDVTPRFKRDAGRIVKVSTFGGMVNARYDRKKAKSLGIEVSEVEVSDTPWKDQVSGPVHVHNGYKRNPRTGEVTYDSPKKGTLYVVYYPASGGSAFSLDGMPCQPHEVKDMVRKGGSNPTGYTLITLDKIQQVKCNGTTYMVAK